MSNTRDADKKTKMNSFFHYLKYSILNRRRYCPLPKISLNNFQDFTYSCRSHWELFAGYDLELYRKKMNMDICTLKEYQDLLVFAFIKDHIPPGSRILDVGGGDSRILNFFAKTHDCWNIDKFEGMGNGLKTINKSKYKLVRDYMGEFNPELSDNTFDFVFSISALEHTPDDQKTFDNIINDINRVLKKDGLSLHLFDILLKANGDMWTNNMVHRIFNTVKTINNLAPVETMKNDKDLYYMSEFSYNTSWIRTTKRKYSEFGRPVSLNILWKKNI